MWVSPRSLPAVERRGVCVISTGQDRKTGHAILRLRADDGRVIALRLRPQQFRTLARGVLGLARARGELGELN